MVKKNLSLFCMKEELIGKLDPLLPQPTLFQCLWRLFSVQDEFSPLGIKWLNWSSLYNRFLGKTDFWVKQWPRYHKETVKMALGDLKKWQCSFSLSLEHTQTHLCIFLSLCIFFDLSNWIFYPTTQQSFFIVEL